MTDRTESWTHPQTAKAKTAVQRSVSALLDELAPERVLRRVDALPATVEQHRTPTGCVLQAADSALSVSWFAESSPEAPLGELHVIVWRGTVTRRGGKKIQKGGAVIVDEIILRPIEPAVDDLRWQALDGSRYDTAALTSKCLALLASQIGSEDKG